MKGILFNTEMVRATLEGRKTETRSPVKNMPVGVDSIEFIESVGWLVKFEFWKRFLFGVSSAWIKPRYQVGDILYVRETWSCLRLGNGRTVPYDTQYWYKADEKNYNPDNKWRPSIHMPKVAARIFLRVTDVRFEKLNDITEEDATAEGFNGINATTYYEIQMTPKVDFAITWDTIYEARGYGWDENPWVEVTKLEVAEKGERG